MQHLAQYDPFLECKAAAEQADFEQRIIRGPKDGAPPQVAAWQRARGQATASPTPRQRVLRPWVKVAGLILVAALGGWLGWILNGGGGV